MGGTSAVVAGEIKPGAEVVLITGDTGVVVSANDESARIVTTGKLEGTEKVGDLLSKNTVVQVVTAAADHKKWLESKNKTDEEVVAAYEALKEKPVSKA